jgi:thioester reductase-like protein
MAEPATLITGYPGFLAGRLVPRLVDAGRTVTALVHPSMLDRAKAGAPAGVDVVAGDITKPQLGLDADTHARLQASVTEVFHLAAIYDLAVAAELARSVNVDGTANVVAFCEGAAQLARHHYVSTAYVAGMRSGTVLESELETGHTFKNHYESTKYEAEVLVRRSLDRVPTTIYRPAIVVGDSQTGETQKFDGPYYLLRAIQATRGPLPKLGSADAPFNVVPVDFVVDAMVACLDNPDAEGRTLHLVDPEPVSAAELFRLLAAAYDGRKPRLPFPPRLLDRAFRSPRVRQFYGGTPRESLRYLNHPVTFDVTNAAAVLGAAGLRCPRLPEYVPPMVRFFKAHADDPAYRPGGAG